VVERTAERIERQSQLETQNSKVLWNGVPKMRSKLTILALMLIATSAGCIKYDERIEMNPDGSGIVRMHIAVAEQLLPPSLYEKSGNEDDLLPVKRAELVAGLEKDGFAVKSLRASSARGLRHFYVVLAFKDLNVLTKSEWFGGRKVSLTKLGGKWRFDQEISVSEDALKGRSRAKADDAKPTKTPPAETIKKQLERRFGTERVDHMLKNYFVSFSVQLTGAGLLSTNGRSHRDRVAVWAIPLKELIGRRPTIKMSAEFAPRSAPTGVADE